APQSAQEAPAVAGGAVPPGVLARDPGGLLPQERPPRLDVLGQPAPPRPGQHGGVLTQPGLPLGPVEHRRQQVRRQAAAARRGQLQPLGQPGAVPAVEDVLGQQLGGPRRHRRPWVGGGAGQRHSPAEPPPGPRPHRVHGRPLQHLLGRAGPGRSIARREGTAVRAEQRRRDQLLPLVPLAAHGSVTASSSGPAHTARGVSPYGVHSADTVTGSPPDTAIRRSGVPPRGSRAQPAASPAPSASASPPRPSSPSRPADGAGGWPSSQPSSPRSGTTPDSTTGQESV